MLSSVFSTHSDPKLQQATQILGDLYRRKKAHLTEIKWALAHLCAIIVI
jgi:hypothetical protein